MIGEWIIFVIDVNCLIEVVRIVCYYYENFDGLGYLDGFKGMDILLFLWIVLLIDNYDVMVVSCFYYKFCQYQVVMDIMISEGGVKYDFDLFYVFCVIIEKLEMCVCND